MIAATRNVFTSTDTRCWRCDAALILSLEKPRPTITTDVLDSLERAVVEAERNGIALIITSSATHFAFGANLNDAFDATIAGHPEVLDAALANYQRVMLRLRYASVPTVAAVRGVAISGGCELLMHCTRVVAHAESRVGLLEASVGLVPGGGGLKEFARRAADSSDPSSAIMRAFETIAAFTVSQSAKEAQRIGYLTLFDHVNAIDPLEEAIEVGSALQASGHVSPPLNPTFRVAGVETQRAIQAAQSSLLESGKLTEHQFNVNIHIAQVLCGGDATGAMRTEADLLSLERVHFLQLMETPLTRARLAYLRSTGKVLAN